MRRRDLLLGAAAVGAGLMLPGASRASPPPPPKLVVLILRGALDGLAAVAPWSDPRYRALRPHLALAAPGEANGLLPLTEDLALHPRLTHVHSAWSAGQCAILHAASTPYRDRSHFDAQDTLEGGGANAYGASTGWLSRALHSVGQTGAAIGSTIPLLLRGPARVTSWAPSSAPPPSDDTLRRLADLYATDPALQADLASAMHNMELVGEATGRAEPGTVAAWRALATAAARLLVAPDGPTAAVISLDGWDTHARQGTTDGPLAARLGALDGALQALQADMGEAWARTVVLVASEFGRTAAENGTGGTDHGTGGVAFALGGAVRGGLVGDWPGLSKLHEDRDLLPANDVRSLFAAAAADHLGADVDRALPGVRPLRDLIVAKSAQ